MAVRIYGLGIPFCSLWLHEEATATADFAEICAEVFEEICEFILLLCSWIRELLWL